MRLNEAKAIAEKYQNENAGYGFDKMFNGWRHYYTKDPVVSEGMDYYRIEFFFDVNVPENVPENRLERIKKKDDR